MTTARARAIAAADQAIQDNVDTIERAKSKSGSALAMMACRLGVSEANLTNTLKATAFKGASDAEFVALVIAANTYGLNPMLKEIYAFPQKGGGIVPVVSVDGWVRIMNAHPAFDGIEFTDIADERGKLAAIEACIWRKDRARPIRVVEYLEECQRKTDPWQQWPARMLRHKALIQCARIAFGFAGIYDADDAPLVGDLSARNVTPPTRDQAARLTAPTTQPDHDPVTGEVAEDPADDELREIAEDLDRASWREAELKMGDE